MSLQATISRLAADFAERIVVAIRAASLAEITTLGSGGPRVPAAPRAERATTSSNRSKLPRIRKGARRSPEAIEKVGASIVALLKSRPEGLRSEDIQRELKLSRKDLPRPLASALAAKLIRKTGAKRATRYFAR